MNPYEILEISPGASAEEIKAAYHQMAKLWHPDRFSGDAKPEAERRFRQLAEAFNMLKDTVRREPAPPPSPVVPAQMASPAPQQIQLDAGAERTVANKTTDEWFQDAKAATENKAYDRALGLIQYAIRLDGERAEFHALYGKLLDLTNGDKRMLVRALETALRLNAKDVDSTILLAQTFQTLGMHARASRLWTVAHNLAPGHAIFSSPGKKSEAKGGKAMEQAPGLGGQLAVLVAEAREAINRFFKRG
jgi:cytochrome c-type biogenesis protein CcmH/NrfG